ncbi:MAG: hypothetical protein D6728_13540 [Cyanobacteria bacterium J055]|nr:MAG: hypothetical protein D6728_13540 [Cyanobacteria bacterium J055]
MLAISVELTSNTDLPAIVGVRSECPQADDGVQSAKIPDAHRSVVSPVTGLTESDIIGLQLLLGEKIFL